jgi:hypothetical protein
MRTEVARPSLNLIFLLVIKNLKNISLPKRPTILMTTFTQSYTFFYRTILKDDFLNEFFKSIGSCYKRIE